MSGHEYTIGLVNKSIDRTASRREEERLRRLMEEDPEVRKLYEETKTVAALLDRTPERHPPQQLKKMIMNSIGAIPAPRNEHEGFIARLRPVLFPRPGYPYVFAAGLVAGILLIVVFMQVRLRENSIDFSNLSGSILGKEMPMDQSLPLTLTEISGRIGMRSADNGMVAEFDLHAYKEVSIRLSYNSNEVDFSGYRTIEGSLRSVTTLQNSAGMTLEGLNKNLMFFKRKSGRVSPFSVEIFSGGRRIFEQTLPAEK
jgi:hypothetical protein